MEKRSRRRVPELVTRLAFQGLSENEIGRARISMMARNTNVPFKGRIQKRNTYHLQIITFRLQRAAGPYSRARGPPSPSTPAFESVEGVATRCQCLSLRWCTNPMQGFYGFDAAAYVIRREQEFFHFEVVDQFGVVLPRSNVGIAQQRMPHH